MLKIQCEWYLTSVVVILLSFGSWVGVAYIVSATTSIDYDYHFVSVPDLFLFFIRALNCEGIPAISGLSLPLFHCLFRVTALSSPIPPPQFYSHRPGRACCRPAPSGWRCCC